MAGQINVSGAAQIKVDTGSSNALEFLGVALDSVVIRERRLTKDVFIDTYGDQMPFDKQYMGIICEVEFTLAWYDPAILEKVRQWPRGTAAGLLGTVGALLTQNVVGTRLVITSPLGGTPRNFPRGYFEEIETPYGVTYTQPKLRYVELPAQNGTVSDGQLVFNGVTTG